MNVLKKLIGGGSGKKNSGGKGEKKHSKDDDEYDYEADHCETDFDQQFEQARRSTSTSVPPPIMSQCEYRGSPSRGTPTKGSGTISNHRSKSPSPLVHATSTAGRDGSPMPGGNHVKRSSAGSTPGTVRKCSEPNWRTAGKRGSPNLPMGQQLDPNAEMKRKLTQTQQKQAKDIVESIDWIQSAPAIHPQVCYASSNPVQPQVVQSQMIVPQIHICEVLPIVRPGKAIAVIPSATDKRAGGPVQPVSASGKVISGGAINRQP